MSYYLEVNLQVHVFSFHYTCIPENLIIELQIDSTDHCIQLHLQFINTYSVKRKVNCKIYLLFHLSLGPPESYI